MVVTCFTQSPNLTMWLGYACSRVSLLFHNQGTWAVSVSRGTFCDYGSATFRASLAPLLAEPKQQQWQRPIPDSQRMPLPWFSWRTNCVEVDQRFTQQFTLHFKHAWKQKHPIHGMRLSAKPVAMLLWSTQWRFQIDPMSPDARQTNSAEKGSRFTCFYQHFPHV